MSVPSFLQLQVQKRTHAGLSLIGSDTCSHSIDNSPGEGASTEQFFPQDWRNLQAERASSDFDQRHRAIMRGVYELPFGRGGSSLVDRLIQGWQRGSYSSA